MTEVRAAVLTTPREPIQLETLQLADPGPGEVRVRVEAAGVCHSDWHLATGATSHPLPAILGHEGAGIVEALGDGVTGLAVGQRVALNWSPFCGHCFYCLRDQARLCEAMVGTTWEGLPPGGEPRFRRADGTAVTQFCALGCFAEATVVHASACVPMGPDVPPEIAALIGCAVTTGVGAVLNTAGVQPGQTVAVFGVGGVGAAALLGARLAGASQVFAIDPSASRREAALGWGATAALDASSDVAAEIRARTDGRGADVNVEAVGVPAVQETAYDAARPGGRIVLAGLAPVGTSTNLPGARITREEKTVIGCYYGSAHAPRDFPRFAELFLAGRLPLDSLIDKHYALDDVNQAYEELLQAQGGRGVIRF